MIHIVIPTHILPFLLVFATLGAPPAFAARAGSQPSHVTAKLVSEVNSLHPGKPAWIGLHLKMQKPWHTYWRNPGDSGMATSVKWNLPEGFSAGPFEWPAPERIVQPPLVSFGYGNEVLLLARLDVPASASGTVKLAGKAKWLECDKVCIPGQSEVSLELPVKPGQAYTEWRETFENARRQMPSVSVTAKMKVTASQIVLSVPDSIFREKMDAAPEFYPYEKDVVTGDLPTFAFESVDPNVRISLQKSPGFSKDSLDASGIIAYGKGKGRKVYEIRAPLQAEASAIPRMILFALLGGLLLNLMPCVFPLISLKIFGLIEQVKQDHSRIRTHWLVFSLGCLLSFWALAGILIALKATGEKLGWGFQLQSPTFLGCLIALFFVLSLNLLGFFEIGMGLTGTGSKLLSKGGYAGSFFSGVLTTVVATPCSAPFMGTAIGFALSQNAAVSLLIFTSLGLGLLLPYLALAAFPSLVRFLPRPGRWMEIFKELLAFPLLATVIWLSWTLGQSAGVNALAISWFSLLFIAFGVWGLRNLKAARVPVAIAGFTSAAILTAMISSLSAAPMELGREAASSPDSIAWKPWSRARLDEARKQGKPVFVDFTAAWCITCQVNERIVFTSSEIKKKFHDLQIVALKADWTNRNPEIADALAEFGRSGIPVYALYAPGGEPWLLPEVITPGVVSAELDKLARR